MVKRMCVIVNRGQSVDINIQGRMPGEGLGVGGGPVS